MFNYKKIDGKDVYFSDFLNVEHFFTSRDIEVVQNMQKICDYLNIEPKNLIKPIQTHSDNIEIVTENKFEYPSCDALILDIKNKAIYLNFADCTPIMLYDEKNNIAAIAHAGWRGTASKIGVKTVLKMQEIFNSKPKDIIALIGPCISFEHFETSKEALSALSKTIQNKNGL